MLGLASIMQNAYKDSIKCLRGWYHKPIRYTVETLMETPTETSVIRASDDERRIMHGASSTARFTTSPKALDVSFVVDAASSYPDISKTLIPKLSATPLATLRFPAPVRPCNRTERLCALVADGEIAEVAKVPTTVEGECAQAL